MSDGLTHQQNACLSFIQRFISESGGVSPSYDQIKDGIGIKSKSGVHRLLTALEERGFIERLPHRARAIHLHTWPAVKATASAEGLLGPRLSVLVDVMARADAKAPAEIIREAVEAYWDGWGPYRSHGSTRTETTHV